MQRSVNSMRFCRPSTPLLVLFAKPSTWKGKVEASGATTIQPVEPNPDPKPGRWALPVVVLAMMAGAWLFLSAAEDPTPRTTTTTLSAAGATTTTAPPAVTTTTIQTVLSEYKRQLGFRDTTADNLLARAQAINTDFDNKATTGFEYQDALAALQTLAEDAKAFRGTMDFLVIPVDEVPELPPTHWEMVAASQAMAVESDAMIAGLRSPDTGQARRAALASFETAVAEYKAKVEQLMAFQAA